jgi:hypothetical protein
MERPPVRGGFFCGVSEISSGKDGTLTGTAKFFASLGMVAGIMVCIGMATAQSSSAAGGTNSASEDPVAQVRAHKSWEHGPFVNSGFGVGDRSQYKFLSVGYQLGKPLTSVVHAGLFSGQFELAGNIMPFWQAYTPAPHYADYICTDSVTGQPYTCSLAVGGGTFTGLSLTPVIMRWNFLTKSRRIQPWAQAAGGLIYTTHKFPPNFQSTQTINGVVYSNFDGGTSVFNFTPQGGFGVHIFTGAKRSIDLGVNAVHISSASLGDRNPGVNASMQIQVGYTFWK